MPPVSLPVASPPNRPQRSLDGKRIFARQGIGACLRRLAVLRAPHMKIASLPAAGICIADGVSSGDGKQPSVTSAPGDRVMVQVSGTYQRVLAAGSLPEEIKRPMDLKVVD
jgi:hypothetical protein